MGNVHSIVVVVFSYELNDEKNLILLLIKVFVEGMVAASRAKKNRLGILIFTAAILGLLSTTGMVDAQSFSTPKDAPVHVWGYVTDEQGAPIPGVLVCTFGEYGDYWRRDLHIFEVNYTDGDGWFELEFASSWNIYMTVLGDNASTPGLDWFPYNVDLDYGFIGEHNVTLRPGATLDVVGQYRSVDIEIRKWDNYRVVDAKNEAIIYYNRHNKVVPNYVFEFITYDLLEFNSSMVAAPADTECYLWYGLRNILNVTDGPLLLHQGQVMTIDIEEYCLQLDLEKIEEKRALAWEKIVEAESYGFYTAQERLDYRKTGDAKQYADNYSKMEFEQIFVEVKNAYLLASGIVTRIDNNYTEAAFSINVITFFIALSSLLLSGVITPNRKTQLISSVILFVIQFGFFSLVYPGSRLIPFSQIIVNCLVSIIGAPIVDRILRLILKRRRGDLGFYDTITATYVIAVRNLKRRRLRSVITGTTLVTMTMGFVALTSLSANYGLVQGKEQLTYASVDGVLMRMHEYESHYGPTDPDYTTDIGNFNPVEEKTQGWLLSNSQVKGLALKAEKQAEHSLPMIGLDPISDPLMTPIDEITTIGEKLRELGTCLVHEARLGKTEKGEYIKILAEDGKTEEYITVYDVDDYIYGLKVVGGFSKEIDKVRDIDGKTILCQNTRELNIIILRDSSSLHLKTPTVEDSAYQEYAYLQMRVLTPVCLFRVWH